jgi:hypothetical protein
MSRLDYRKRPVEGGQRTAFELSLVLPVPLLMIIEGLALPRFPQSTRGGPSTEVRVLPLKPDKRMSLSGLPLSVMWTQWRDVAVPVLEDLRVYRWRGKVSSLGDPITLLVDVYGPGGTLVWEEGDSAGRSKISEQAAANLYACDPPSVRGSPQSKTYQYLQALSGIILARALSSGY